MKNIDDVDVSDWLRDNDVTEAVSISKNEQPHAVIIPYEIFQIMHKQNRQAMRVEDLSKEDIEVIANSRIPEENRRYDDEADG